MISLEDVSIRQGSFVLDRISFLVESSAYAVLMGPTGAGKTSLVEAICGLRPVAAGRIAIGGRDITRERPGNRNVGYVPQDAALFPTLTVAEHLAFALRVRRRPDPEIRARVGEIAEQLGIAALLKQKPATLSGGERQRVALGRALAANPAVLCLDEPLSALDESTRDRIHDLLLAIHRITRVTILHVTHDKREAERLATARYTLESGRLRPI